MFSKQQTLSHFDRQNIFIWLSMAFQAGTINTGGYLACHRFVSHVTGFGTLVGSESADGNYMEALNMASVPLFFVAGTMISAFFIDRRIQQSRKPLYPLVMFIILLLTVLVTVGGTLGYFGDFGAPFKQNDYPLLAALCLACGIQNATVTSSFGAVIRTTHLTGITTDLGIGIIRVLSQSHKIQPRQNEIRANWMRAGLISSFITGSFISAYFYQIARYWGFLIPMSIATILFLWSLMHHFKFNGLSTHDRNP